MSFAIESAICDEVQAVTGRVAGAESSLAQVDVYCETGEDEFTRHITIFVFYLGSPVAPPRLLLQGSGQYGNSFGVCERIDTHLVEARRPGVVTIERMQEVVRHPNPDRLPVTCRPIKVRKTTVTAIEF